MRTETELTEWIQLREKECLDIHYELINSLNYPKIDRNVRILRSIFFNLEQQLASVRFGMSGNDLNKQQQEEQQYDELEH